MVKQRDEEIRDVSFVVKTDPANIEIPERARLRNTIWHVPLTHESRSLLPDLKRRFQATFAEEGAPLGQQWPKGCVEAPTAFLVIVGPSMGGNRAWGPVTLGGANRPECDTMTIGRDVQTYHLRRPAVWMRLCAEILGNKACVARMTHS